MAAQRIALVGLGMGGVDAAIAAALDGRIAACAAVGAITVRDWAEHVFRLEGGAKTRTAVPAKSGWGLEEVRARLRIAWPAGGK